MLLRKKSVAAMKVNNDCWSDFVRKARARPLEPLFVAAASAGFKGQPFGPIQQRHSPVTGSQQASCKARSGAPRDAGQAARVPSTANKRTTSLPTVSPRVPVATVVGVRCFVGRLGARWCPATAAARSTAAHRRDHLGCHARQPACAIPKPSSTTEKNRPKTVLIDRPNTVLIDMRFRFRF